MIEEQKINEYRKILERAKFYYERGKKNKDFVSVLKKYVTKDLTETNKSYKIIKYTTKK